MYKLKINSKTYLASEYVNTKDNKEDFALTPYLSIHHFKGRLFHVIGFGITWGNHARSFELVKKLF